MGVRIDEARRDDHSVRANPVCLSTGEPGHGLQDAAVDHDLARTLATGRRVDQPGPADLEIEALARHEGTFVPASR